MLIDALARLANVWTDEVTSWGWLSQWASLLNTTKSRAGPNITPSSALAVSAVFRATEVVSDGLACLPLFLYERDGENGKTPARKHPLWNLLHSRPNPDMSIQAFKKLLAVWCVLWGNGRAEIQRNGAGEPIALWPINPSRCQPDWRGTQLYHRVVNNDGTTTLLPDRDVLNFFKFSFDGMLGISAVGFGRNSLGLSVAAEDYAGNFFANNATPSGVLEHPGDLGGDPNDPKILALRRAWSEAYSGDNSQGIMVLEEGMKYQALGMPHKDAQFLETREFQVVEVARWFGVEPHLLMDLSRAHFANIESSDLNHDRHCIMPYAVALEQQCNLKLLPADSEYFFEFQMDGLLRADAKTRAEVLQIKRRSGVLTANEWRAFDNQNPVDDGDIMLVPQELTTMEGLLAKAKATAQTGNRKPPPAKSDESMSAWLADILSRMAKVHTNAMQRVERKKLDAESKAAAVNDLLDEHKQRTAEAMGPWLNAAGLVYDFRMKDIDAELSGFYLSPSATDCAGLARSIMGSIGTKGISC